MQVNLSLIHIYCCEPIGPEHTPEELAEQILFGREFGGCFQNGAMNRIYIPGSPLARYGQITELKLGQVTAVVALAMLETEATKTIGVHEPNPVSYTHLSILCLVTRECLSMRGSRAIDEVKTSKYKSIPAGSGFIRI